MEPEETNQRMVALRGWGPAGSHLAGHMFLATWDGGGADYK